VQRDMLLGYQSGANACAQVLVEKLGYFLRGNVLSAFEKSTGEDSNGV
jgi:hypothetical protein